jgi:hypothetical protein
MGGVKLNWILNSDVLNLLPLDPGITPVASTLFKSELEETKFEVLFYMDSHV